MIVIMKNLFKNVYYEVESHSRDQLEKDFGEFPPKGLVVDESLLTPFRIAFGNRVGFWIYFADRMKGIFHVLHASPRVAKAKAGILELKKSLNDANFLIKAVLIIFLLMLTSPVLILLLFIIVMQVKAIISIMLEKSEPGIGGFFSGFPGLDNKFVVKSEHCNDGGIRLDGTIAHEHLHLLQFLRVPRTPQSYFEVRKAARISGIVSKDMNSSSYFLYLFERNEVEARLHELVLSFYRVNHCLPDAIEGFIGLVGLNEEISEGCLALVKLDKAYFLEHHGYRPYSTRYPMIAKQFDQILESIETDEDTLRFGLEVLPVMYANLLDYYGDPAAAMRFRQQIQGPGMFERIYG